MSIEDRLLAIKRKIDAKKDEVSRLNGQIDEMQRTLKEDFGVNTIADATKLLEKLTKEADELEAKLTEEVEALEAQVERMEMEAK